MTDNGFTFFVRGLPATQGSMKAIMSHSTGRPIVVRDNPKGLTAWRRAIGDEARSAAGFTAPVEGPVAITAHFFLPRPLGHFGTGRNAGVLKPSAPAFPTTKPDADKLVRARFDALKSDAAAYRDDAQVVRMVVSKDYADHDYPPGVEVHFRRFAA